MTQSAGTPKFANPVITRNRHAIGSGVSRRRWPRSGEQIAGTDHDLGCKLLLGLGELGQQALVAGEMIEHAEQEIRFTRRVPQRLGFDPGERQEAAEPFRLFGNETEGPNCQRFGRFA